LVPHPRLVLGLQLLQVSGTVLPLSKETVPAMHLGPAGSVELRGAKKMWNWQVSTGWVYLTICGKRNASGLS